MAKKRGLAAVPIKRRREIASMGGTVSQASGKGHQWTDEEASKAGKKGGKGRPPGSKNKPKSKNSEFV